MSGEWSLEEFENIRLYAPPSLKAALDTAFDNLIVGVHG